MVNILLDTLEGRQFLLQEGSRKTLATLNWSVYLPLNPWGMGNNVQYSLDPVFCLNPAKHCQSNAELRNPMWEGWCKWTPRAVNFRVLGCGTVKRRATQVTCKVTKSQSKVTEY
jgi:hypothetical protein